VSSAPDERGPFWRRPELWVAICSAIVVLVVGVVDTGRTSPGPLAGPHARLPELAGRDGCAECHGGWFEDMSSACLDCHTDVAEHMESGRGLHGALAPGERRCASCHSDHHGGNFQMVNAASFAKAGVPDVQAFDHARVGWLMDGAHLELDCSECHAHAFAESVPEGEQRFMGLASNCASCHEDPHEGAFGRACADCHVQTSFETHVSVGHDEFLPLVGGHGDVTCRACHAEGDPHALEMVARGRRDVPARTCTACHQSPHGLAFESGTAELAARSADSACVVCHAAEHDSFRDERLELSPDQHATSGFPLALPHDQVACEACHDPALASFAERYPGRERDACAACHEDPHGGQFATGPFAAEGCVACHGRERFEPHGFDAALHARTSLPLEGRHLAAACEDCHTVPGPDAPRVFRGTDGTCATCHSDAHAGFFDARCAPLDPVAHGDCARCHDATAFDHVPDERFDHGAWTGFPLGGAHASDGCEICHATRPEPDEHGRTFGRVAPPHGTIEPLGLANDFGRACAACHQDPHGGAFDAPHLARAVDGRLACARCHVDTSFRDLAHGFDHGAWTGFPLDGAHGALACADCHAPLPAADPTGRTSQRAAGTACAACHDDPHGGQFDVPLAEGSGALASRAGATAPADCARCHTPLDTFARLRFEHDWDSRFKLDATHAKLACAACHRAETIGGDATFRYKPLGTACTDCHGVDTTTLRDD
jgi:hypothetical protein